MELAGIYRNVGDIIQFGHKLFDWNDDGTLREILFYADAAKTQLVLRKLFTWNADGTLAKWDLTVTTTGEVLTKTFTWDSVGQLVETGVSE